MVEGVDERRVQVGSHRDDAEAEAHGEAGDDGKGRQHVKRTEPARDGRGHAEGPVHGLRVSIHFSAAGALPSPRAVGRHGLPAGPPRGGDPARGAPLRRDRRPGRHDLRSPQLARHLLRGGPRRDPPVRPDSLRPVVVDTFLGIRLELLAAIRRGGADTAVAPELGAWGGDQEPGAARAGSRPAMRRARGARNREHGSLGVVATLVWTARDDRPLPGPEWVRGLDSGEVEGGLPPFRSLPFPPGHRCAGKSPPFSDRHQAPLRVDRRCPSVSMSTPRGYPGGREGRGQGT